MEIDLGVTNKFLSMFTRGLTGHVIKTSHFGYKSCEGLLENFVIDRGFVLNGGDS